jgi:ABC-type multidrug transport system fused ATPase/permease subunit
MYKKDFLLSGMLKLVNTLIQFLPSLIIAKLLKHIDTHSKIQGPLTKALLSNKGFLLASLLLVTLCAKTTVENQYFDVATALGSGIRGTLSSAVFRKSLRLSPTGRQNNTVGEIVNFSQLDTTRMEYVASSIHILWDGSLQVLGYTCLLIHFLGPSVFAGIFAMVGIIPLNTFFLNKYACCATILL